MTNDKEIFDAMRVDPSTGQREWTGRAGTREAIRREGLVIDPISQLYCPHEWIDSSGYVDLDLARKHPNPHSD
jgi:hypothetical protein